LILQGKSVLHTEIGVKSIGPKTGVQIGSNQHGAKSVANSLVSSFDGTILVRAISSSQIDGVSKTLKQRTNFLVVEELSSLI
jgi:hypothetical protein